MVMIVVVAIIWPGIAPRDTENRFFDMEQWRGRLVGLVAMIPVIALIAIVLGTIYAGIATPSEAAAFGVSGALIIGIALNSEGIWQPALAMAVKRTGAIALLPAGLQAIARDKQDPSIAEFNVAVRRNMQVVQEAFMSTVRTTGMIFLIVLAAFTMSFAFARLGISQDIADAITSFDLNAITLVIVLCVFYIVLGTFMESFSMLVTTIPILVPTLEDVGVDLVWFGIIMVILVEAALISPPEGINLYVLHGVRQDITREMAEAEGVAVQQGTIADVWIGVLPFMFMMGVAIALIIAFPDIALWLPNLVKGERFSG